MAAIPLITAIATAIAEGSKIYHTWLKGRARRKMEATIEAGEKYIFTNEDVTLTDKKRASLLLTYRKRFFKYN